MLTLSKKLGLTSIALGIFIVSHTLQAQSNIKGMRLNNTNTISPTLSNSNDTLLNVFVKNFNGNDIIKNKYLWSTKANLFNSSKSFAFDPDNWNAEQKIEYKPSKNGFKSLALNNELTSHGLFSLCDDGKNIRIENNGEVLFLNKLNGIKDIKSNMEIVQEASGQKVLVLQSRILLGSDESSEQKSQGLAQNHGLQFDYLKFYPNPAANNINIQFRLANQGDVKVNILNLLGQSVYSEELSNFSGDYKQSVNLQAYGNGTYILQIVQGKRTINRKIVVA